VTSEGIGARIQLASTETYHSVEPPDDADQWYVGSIPDEPYDIPKIDRSRLRADLRRETVSAPEDMPANTIVVDIDNRHLFFYPGDGTAIRYGIGVGRRGFSWQGNASVGRKSAWPDWIPTANMRTLIPNLPASMEGGLDSPLGARALYLYQNGQDILFRIHGTNEPWTIGEQVSSGCIRMLNEDVADLYNRVEIGAKVILRNSKYASTRVSQSE
jgi:lipoprotein-anchoring transpeptidase ErfK/SrfK